MELVKSEYQISETLCFERFGGQPPKPRNFWGIAPVFNDLLM